MIEGEKFKHFTIELIFSRLAVKSKSTPLILHHIPFDVYDVLTTYKNVCVCYFILLKDILYLCLTGGANPGGVQSLGTTTPSG